MVSSTTMAEGVEATGLELLEKGCAEIVLTVRCVNHWRNLRCVVSGRKDGLLLLHPADPQEAGEDFIIRWTLGAKVGGLFRHHGRKYTFATRLRQRSLLTVGGTTTWLIVVDFPQEVARGSRRAYPRTACRTLGEIRCLLWPDGLAAQPEGEDPSMPAWAGNVLDVGQGGLCMCVEPSARDLLTVGDRVGGSMQPANTGPRRRFEARVCHIERFSTSLDSVGLQFIEAPAGADGAEDDAGIA